jgi:5'-methylthioadenosine phosphorylase
MIGFIGGSGLYELDGLENVREQELETPFGRSSDAYVCGRLGGREVCFLPRHGRGHRLLPSEINHRANIFGFKLLGARCVVSVSAVGSLREDHRPRDVVLPDQYVDRTKQSRAHTFFGDGIVAHVAFAEPGCAPLRQHLAAAVRTAAAAGGRDVAVHVGGTYVNMEGPAFSTRAESNLYRREGFDVIGMTSLPEAKLCREAEICYQAMAMVTDYDCWHESEETVSVQLVLGHLIANTELARAALPLLVSGLPDPVDWPCRLSLANAIMTQPAAMPPDTLERLRPIIGPYV